MSEVRKWACEYCTYENYQASKKCVLCHATKPPTLINEVAENMNQDIYKIAPLVTAATTRSSTSASICCTSSSSTSSVVGGGSGIDLKAKWTCQACTYLNWPKSTKCVQCLTLRTNSSFSKSSQDHSLPLRIDVNIAGATARKPDKNSPRTSPKSPEATKELNNDRNRLMSAALKTSSSVLPGRINTSSVHSNLHASLRTCASAIKAPKWTCWTCTYENWARTVKCAMCGTIKAGKNIDGATASTSNTLSNRAYDLRIIDSSTASGRRIKRSPPVSPNNMERLVGGAAAPPVIYHDKNSSDECRLKQIRNKMQKKDWLWLNACVGVVEGDAHSLEAFISSGGDPGRQLNHEECTLLNRPSAFDIGFTLVHLAIRFQREDMLAVLLAATDIAAKGKKRVPSHITPDLAADILRDIASCLRQRKGDFPCYFLTEHATFALPADIVDLPRPVQKQLFDELLDCDVQHELEVEELVINWSLELTDHLGSRLYPLWNRTAGDCLLDSVLQATWGVFDRDNTLRRSLGDSLGEGATTFYPRWKEYESLQAQAMQFTLEDAQWVLDWDILLNLASQPGASLEQTHIFAIAHILRRPIIVYGVKYVKSFRGETIGYARFQGVYLPLLWEQSFCWKTPIALGYTRGHFSALVPMEIDLDANMGAGANIDSNNDPRVAYLPLTDSESKLLPIHFLTATELGREESLLREWLDCSITDGGTLVARMKFGQRPAMVRQMTDEWLDGYRRLSKVVQTAHTSPVFSSDGETDDE